MELEAVEERKAEEDDLEGLDPAADEVKFDAGGVLDQIVEKEPPCPAQEKLIDEIAMKKDKLTKLYKSKELVCCKKPGKD